MWSPGFRDLGYMIEGGDDIMVGRPDLRRLEWLLTIAGRGELDDSFVRDLQHLAQ